MEEPMAEYSIEELEAWVLKRLLVEESWDIQPSAPLQVRRIVNPGKKELTRALIVPGGRWLLVLSDEEIFYCDLDSLDIEPRLLLRFSAVQEYPPTWSIWIDDSKPRLTFRIVVSGWSMLNLGSRPKGWIYEVTLVGHGSDASLVSGPPLVTINGPQGVGLHPVVTLEERCCVLAGSGFVGHVIERSWLSVYSFYTQANGTQPINPRTIEIDSYCMRKANIIPSDSLLIMTQRHFDIYDYSEVKKDAPPESLQPRHRIHLEVYCWDSMISDPTHIDYTTRIMFLLNNVITGISIPDNHEIAPTLTVFGEMPPNRSYFCGVGYKRSLVTHGDGYAKIVRHNWHNLDKPMSLVEHLVPKDICGQPFDGVSEERGRFAIVCDLDLVAIVDILSLSPP